MSERYTDSGAVFSPCEVYRYRLWRSWLLPFDARPDRRVAFIGLNPSTADAEQDDPTVRRCALFAIRWGFTGMEMLNLFGIRSTDPRGVWSAEDPVGPGTDSHLVQVARACDLVIACWGAFPKARERARAVTSQLAVAGVEVRILGVTKEGDPRHPLYLKNSASPTPWGGPPGE